MDSSDVSDYKALNVDTAKETGGPAASGDRITDLEGNEYVYHAAGEVRPAGGTYGDAGWYDKDDTKTTLTATIEEGWKYTTASTGKTQTLVGDKTDTTAASDLIYNTNDIATAIKSKLSAGDKVTISGTEYTIGTTSNGTTLTADDLVTKLESGQTITITNKSGSQINDLFTGVNLADNTSRKVYVVGDDDKDSTTIDLQTAYRMMTEELKVASSIGTDSPAKVVNHNNGKFTITQGEVEVKNPLSFNLHVGSDAYMSNKINVNIETMSAANLGIKGINVSDETGNAATYAIDAISDALAKVSSQRSSLGAIQNRLEHSIANLDNVVENTTSAESRIRDTDMAEEMVEYSKNNILAQAGQSMLAQANQSTQGVMSLLQ